MPSTVLFQSYLVSTLLLSFIVLIGFLILVQDSRLSKLSLKQKTCEQHVPPTFEAIPILPANNGTADEIWQRKIYRLQEKTRQIANEEPKFLNNVVYSIIPQLICPEIVRIGRAKDGGKFMCRPWRAPANCVVYSLGVGMDVSFETELVTILSTCRIYAFDSVSAFARNYLFTDPLTSKQAKFFPWKIGLRQSNFSGQNTVSITEICQKLGHDHIEVLKIDIEGSELDALPDFFQTSNVSVCQLLIEMHGIKIDSAEFYSGLLKLIEHNGFAMYSKDVGLCGFICVEYSFLHRNCFSSYGLSVNNVLHLNFDGKPVDIFSENISNLHNTTVKSE